MSATESAEKITRASKSNLALAFVSLPPERRRDMTTFYAFCRIVDDIADEPSRSPGQKRDELDAWKKSITTRFEGEPGLANEVRDLIRKYNIPAGYFYEIIAGVGMDIEPARFRTFEDLRLYCYRVASAVGLASIEIFGYKSPECKKYAVDLGLALQLTNILRDVAQDFSNGGRIYLPLEDLERFDYSENDLAAGLNNRRFQALMEFEAARADGFYESAVAALPRGDRKSMAAAEIMRKVYHRLLGKMKRDRFRVFEQRYSLSKLEKIWMIAGVLVRNL
jgi:phytoene synthase